MIRPDEEGISCDALADFAMEAEQAAAARMLADHKAAKQAKIDEKASALDSTIPIENIFERAKAVKKMMVPAIWGDNTEIKGSKDNPVTVPISCDGNRLAALRALFHGPRRPYFDEYRGQAVDFAGNVVDPKRYPVGDIMEAMARMGLKGQAIKSTREVFLELAEENSHNSMTRRFMASLDATEWDGRERLIPFSRHLIKYMESELTDQVMMYWWLSLYNRITSPGCYAPVTIALIGAQHCGKSWFYNLTAKHAMNDVDAAAVEIDLSQPELEILRQIIGSSVIAVNGEMAGFGKADVSKWKAYIARQMDRVHWKYSTQVDVPRQYINVADANDYDGFQRDSTGNRRQYPIFVGQLPMKDGKPQWRPVGFKMPTDDYTKEVFWQIMAECREWMNSHGTGNGYRDFVDDVSMKVQSFSAEELRTGRGATRNDALDVYGLDMVLKCDRMEWENAGGSNRAARPAGIFLAHTDLMNALKKLSGNDRSVSPQKVTQYMLRFGVEKRKYKIPGTMIACAGYFFEKNEHDWERLARGELGMLDEGEEFDGEEFDADEVYKYFLNGPGESGDMGGNKIKPLAGEKRKDAF